MNIKKSSIAYKLYKYYRPIEPTDSCDYYETLIAIGFLILMATFGFILFGLLMLIFGNQALNSYSLVNLMPSKTFADVYHHILSNPLMALTEYFVGSLICIIIPVGVVVSLGEVTKLIVKHCVFKRSPKTPGLLSKLKSKFCQPVNLID